MRSAYTARCSLEEVRVATHHVRTLPATEFLQRLQRRPGLDVPAGPGVPQVVPPEVGNPCALQRRPLGFSVDLGEAVAVVVNT